MIKFFLAFMLAVSFLTPFYSTASEPVHTIKINGRELNDKLCKEMSRFKIKHVRDFFKRATPISLIDLHSFEQLDCHILGTLKRGKITYRFNIQPIGIGYLQEKMVREYFGCSNCNDLFPPK